MTWAAVLGGAECVYPDLERAKALLGEPDCIIAVKDIGMEYPKVDFWCTYHIDRMPRELGIRRKLGYPDPKALWTYQGVRAPKGLGVEVRFSKVRGGSSGLLGAFVAIEEGHLGVLCGIPMDMDMRHYHNRKHGKPWKEGRLYKPHWLEAKPKLLDRVKSMNGWTKELLGEPTYEWVHGNEERGATPAASDTAAAPVKLG